MKSKKLNLDELKVKSFVTDLEKKSHKTIKGGLQTIVTCGFGQGWCDSYNITECVRCKVGS